MFIFNNKFFALIQIFVLIFKNHNLNPFHLLLIILFLQNQTFLNVYFHQAF